MDATSLRVPDLVEDSGLATPFSADDEASVALSSGDRLACWYEVFLKATDLVLGSYIAKVKVTEDTEIGDFG